MPRIPVWEQPRDCATCAASCPLKKKGCAYDAVQEAARLEETLAGLGVEPDFAGLVEELAVRAKACRQGILGEVQKHNDAAHQAEQLLDLILPALGLPATPSAAEPEPSRGDEDLYVDAEDQKREAEARSLPGVHGLCATPKLSLDNLPSFKERLQERLLVPPFEGLVAAIAKRHRKDARYCRVTAYYRGPAPAEAQKLLKREESE